MLGVNAKTSACLRGAAINAEFFIKFGALASGIPTQNAATEALQHLSVAAGTQTLKVYFWAV